MPEIVDRLERQLAARGVKNPRAAAIEQLQKHGVLEKGSADQLTKYGHIRNMMSPAERAVDRAVKASEGKHRPADYTYDPKTNRATLKQR